MTRDVRIAWLLAGCAGCVSIHRDVKVVDYPEGTRHVDRTVDGSRSYRTTTEIDDDRLVVKLTQVDVCEQADVPIVRRRRLTIKTEVPSLFGIQAEWLAGAAGMAFGGLMILNPERACSQTGEDGSSRMTDPQTCAAVGWGLVGLGAVFTAVAVIDSLRLRDEAQDLGTREGDYVASRRDCHAGPVANTSIELRSAAARPLRGRTSALGEAAFSMIDIDEDALPSPARPVTIAIGDAVVAVRLSEQQHQALSRHLRDNPHSRAARGAEELQQKACNAAVADADRIRIPPDADDNAIVESQAAWQRARLTCALRWAADHQQRMEAVEAAILHNRVGAILIALKAGDLDRVDDALAKTPAVLARLRDDPDLLQPLRKMVGEPAHALVFSRRGDAALQRRVCRARVMFLKIRGPEAWERLKIEIARNISELGGGVQSNIVRLLDAARCG